MENENNTPVEKENKTKKNGRFCCAKENVEEYVPSFITESFHLSIKRHLRKNYDKMSVLTKRKFPYSKMFLRRSKDNSNP